MKFFHKVFAICIVASLILLTIGCTDDDSFGENWCSAFMKCYPGEYSSKEECIADDQDWLDDAESAGCLDEANALNGCQQSFFSNSCDEEAMEDACEQSYDDLNNCVGPIPQ